MAYARRPEVVALARLRIDRSKGQGTWDSMVKTVFHGDNPALGAILDEIAGAALNRAEEDLADVAKALSAMTPSIGEAPTLLRQLGLEAVADELEGMRKEYCQKNSKVVLSPSKQNVTTISANSRSTAAADANDIDALLTEEEAAEILTVPVSRLRGWRKRKRGPAVVKLGTARSSAIRYTRRLIREWQQRYIVEIERPRRGGPRKK